MRVAKRSELNRNFTAGGLAPIGVLVYICDLTAILSSTEEATQLKSPVVCLVNVIVLPALLPFIKPRLFFSKLKPLVFNFEIHSCSNPLRT